MAKETGHARNVECFAQMISFVHGYSLDYAPSNAAIAVAALQAGIDGVSMSDLYMERIRRNISRSAVSNSRV